jgi:hypothetical protein
MAMGAPTRANVYPMRAISARSRNPMSVLVSIEASRAPISSADSTEVLPFLTLCRGPRTACAELSGINWPITSQSNGMEMAARCCLREGGPARWLAVGTNRPQPGRAGHQQNKTMLRAIANPIGEATCWHGEQNRDCRRCMERLPDRPNEAEYGPGADGYTKPVLHRSRRAAASVSSSKH